MIIQKRTMYVHAWRSSWHKTGRVFYPGEFRAALDDWKSGSDFLGGRKMGWGKAIGGTPTEISKKFLTIGPRPIGRRPGQRRRGRPANGATNPRRMYLYTRIWYSVSLIRVSATLHCGISADARLLTTPASVLARTRCMPCMVVCSVALLPYDMVTFMLPPCWLPGPSA